MADIVGINAAATVSNGGKDNKTSEILSTARSRLAMAMDAHGESRGNQLEDLKFAAGSPDNNWQWSSDVLNDRGPKKDQSARPCLTINKLPQHVKQITNEQRQNRPSGKVIPVDDNADPEIAEIYNGIIRHIEYISDADVAYDTACDSQVTHGEGYFRILTDYTEADSFDQDIKIGRIRNIFGVYMDPMMQDPCGSDAEWGFVTDDLTKEEYHRLYPDAASVSTLQNLGVGDQSIAQWIGENTVRIAEYFYIEHVPAKLNLYPGNLTAFDGTPKDKSLFREHGEPLKSRQSDKRTVRWVKTNGYEILEEREWAGRYIPIIRVIGNEFEVEGRVYLSGIVRNAKDAQRMYNYWTSQEAEMLALAPKAPFIGYGGQFEGYENQWKTANTRNWPFLEVNPDVTDGQGQVLPLPQRAAPPMAQTGLIQAKQGASEDIKATTGQYNASLGMTSNERSGKAILARQKEGDVGTYHYVDNLARAIRYGARQLVDLIPKIYDTQRIARIIGEDGESKMVKINPNQPEAVKKHRDQDGIVIDVIYNPMVGKYDVRTVTGPGYATKRQEALEAMAQLLQGNPQLWAVAGDLFVKNMDWPGAQELAKRFAKTIDPKLMQEGDENPELQQAQMQMQAMAQEMEQMYKMLQNVNQSMEARDLMIKSFEAQIKAYDAETKRISATQAGMTQEQIQEIVRGTIDAAIHSGDLIGQLPSSAPIKEPVAPEMQMPEMQIPVPQMPQQ